MHPRRRRGRRRRASGRPRPQGRGGLLTADLPPEASAEPPLGAYIHIPFCASRCDYCAFATWTDRPHLIDAYVDAVVAHARATFAADPTPVTSVFFGGGTPSLIPAASLVRILDEIPRVPDAEVTVECNPETVTDELLDVYVEGGVDRVSFGVQSMVPSVLDALGRHHTPGTVQDAVAGARRAGLRSFNLDLIYGGSGETLEDWTRTVDEALALEPPHVSAYALTVEAGTPLAADRARHPDDDDQADKYLLVTERMAAAGLDWYEISNWARAGHECRHNLLYWAQGDYHALGCAAHGHRHGRRWWNMRTPERYIESVTSGVVPEAGHEELDRDDRRIEGLQLALRTTRGVPLDALAIDLADPSWRELVEVDDGIARLTVAGRLLANEVALRLV